MAISHKYVHLLTNMLDHKTHLLSRISMTASALDRVHNECPVLSQYSVICIYYPPEVTTGNYWGLKVFNVAFLPIRYKQVRYITIFLMRCSILIQH